MFSGSTRCPLLCSKEMHLTLDIFTVEIHWHFYTLFWTALFLCRHVKAKLDPYSCPCVYMTLHSKSPLPFQYFQWGVCRFVFKYVLFLICVLDKVTHKQTICAVLHRGSRVDVVTYLMLRYHDNWHVTQHNKTMNTHTQQTREPFAGVSLCLVLVFVWWLLYLSLAPILPLPRPLALKVETTHQTNQPPSWWTKQNLNQTPLSTI